MITENEQTLHLLKTGDEHAFDTIYKQYYRGLCAFASQYVAETEIEEIVQEVMMWLWENRASLVPELSLKSLLFMMVKNKCLNNITHNQIKQRVHEKLFAKFENQFEDPDFYIENELIALAAKAIRELPEDYRRAFEMNRFDNLTYNEIAERTGVSPKTVAYRISQALKILRVELKDYMPLLMVLLS
ncbi:MULTISPECIES: RNA polymerase sigma-70 factor [Parabacteroides]|uniref:RNA polymerase sigma-70 factor n=1 Tax=Parabacteroides TaxID=375288 RepID=UPI000B41B5DB|nr:RNA polymerase sigma-70 factor [Parabacteroides gordonii]